MLNIDSQVQQRMDQFRGRPQDLMQQYQMSRELIDLLALQKLKSEKDAAARSMMMQMQQNPQTIAAQREAELMGRTQQEVAQQVGGIAQLAEARKQQNLQRMASGAQPPVRMAQGGIARFAGPEGSFVEEDLPWYRRLSLFGRPLVREDEFALIDRPLIREGEFALINRPLIREGELALGRELRENIADYMEAERENRTPVVRTGRGGERGPSVFEQFSNWRQENLRKAGFADEPTPATAATPAPMRDLTPEEARDIAGIDALLRQAPPRDENVSVVDITPVQAPGLPDVTMPNVEPDGLAAVEAPRPSMSSGGARRAREIAGELFGAVPTVTAPTIQMPTEQIQRQRAAATALEEAVAGMDPEAARARAAETLRREEIRNAAMRRAEGLQALYERQRDPALLAKERRSAFLGGLYGASSLGTAGGGAALAAERARQRAQERQDLEELNRLRTDIDTADIEIGRDILSAGDTAMQELGAARRQGLQSATGELQSALRVNSEQARNILNAAVQNAQVESDRAKEAADIYRDSVEAGRADFTAALGVVGEYQNLVTAIFDSLVSVRGLQTPMLTTEDLETIREQAEAEARAQMGMEADEISRLIQQTRAFQLAPMIERGISGATIEQ